MKEYKQPVISLVSISNSALLVGSIPIDTDGKGGVWSSDARKRRISRHYNDDDYYYVEDDEEDF